ncbi:MAG: 1-acyl-sn-glycerol-3-phosphate acyltransferase [Anaerolineaceae bacterium]|nr:1-acyl-sn-glycerol-3-phosphate acyltransferase [Anaerolineaceae bacterium]
MLKLLINIGIEIVRWPYLVLFFWLRGWRIEAPLPEIDKMVVAAAPHTTNWDYSYFLAAAASFRRRPLVTVKLSLLQGATGWFIKLMGGVGIDRSKSTNAVQAMAEMIKERDCVIFVFTPDGTRSYRPHWRTGFYYTAIEAGVPIVLGYIDYPRKRVGFSQPIHPTGNLQTDFAVIKEYYRTRGVGLYPEKAAPVELPPYERKDDEADDGVEDMEQTSDSLEASNG